jgi:hypothetical protein
VIVIKRNAVQRREGFFMNDSEKRAADAPAYLNEKQLAQRLNMSLKWVQAKRWQGGGVEYCKFGNSVRYPLDEVERYEREQRRNNTSDQGPDA